MKEIRGKLIERIKRTEAVESFRFKLDEKLDFLPGQFTQVIFDENDKSNKVLNKYLSFSCSPGKDYIEVTKKLSDSDFSKKLKVLKRGDEILFKGPMGNCVFKDEYKKIGFLIGGIGITPVISILQHISEKRLNVDVCMLYSNRTEKHIAFKKELDSFKSSNNIKIVYSVDVCETGSKECFVGQISKDFFKSQMCDYDQRLFFIFGPPAMVSAMKKLCLDTGIKGEMIKAENFIGY